MTLRRGISKHSCILNKNYVSFTVGREGRTTNKQTFFSKVVSTIQNTILQYEPSDVNDQAIDIKEKLLA